MATRKFLYGDAIGYPREQDPADDIALGGLAMSGNVTMGTNQITGLTGGDSSNEALAYGQSGASLGGLSVTDNPLNMNSQQITNVADATLAHHAINKGQLDTAVIVGGSLKELVLHENQLSDTEGALAAVALTMAVNPASGDTITITDGTTTRTYGAGTGGDVQYTIGATVADSMTNLAAAIIGDGSAAWGAYFSTDLDAIDADGAVVIIEDDNDGTASEIYGTWATPANCQIVDFGGETQYNKKTTTNLPASDPASTNFGFRRTQSALSAGELHYTENNDVMYGWDSDAEQWNDMSGSLSIPDATSASGGGVKGKVTFDRDFGLSVTSGIAKISLATNKGLGMDGSGDLQGLADTAAGMEITSSGFAIDLAANKGIGFDGSGDLEGLADTAAGMEITSSGFAIDIGVTNPGVGFDGSGDLEAKVVTAGGIEKAATGLQIKIDDTPDTLDVDGDGLKVVGVPSLFKINGSAVSANVTQVNLDALTGGGSTALHSHAGSGEAQTITNAFTATEGVTLGDPVYIDDQGNAVSKALASNDSKYETVGVAKTTEIATASVDVVSFGPADVLSGATAGNRYYLAAAGGLSTSVAAAGNWVVLMGWAMDANTLFVMPRVMHKRFA